LDKTYRPGDRLPRDEDIASKLGCARSTVQRAMRDLSDAGIVERKRKGGTQVRTGPVTRATLDIPVTRTEVEQRGGIYGYQLLLQATEDIARQLEILVGAALFVMERTTEINLAPITTVRALTTPDYQLLTQI